MAFLGAPLGLTGSYVGLNNFAAPAVAPLGLAGSYVGGLANPFGLAGSYVGNPFGVAGLNQVAINQVAGLNTAGLTVNAAGVTTAGLRSGVQTVINPLTGATTIVGVPTQVVTVGTTAPAGTNTTQVAADPINVNQAPIIATATTIGGIPNITTTNPQASLTAPLFPFGSTTNRIPGHHVQNVVGSDRVVAPNVPTLPAQAAFNGLSTVVPTAIAGLGFGSTILL